ncbi:hypothetical protein B5181_43415, partial [Streptomyces sp. 4F]
MSTFSPLRALTATAAAVTLLATFGAGSASAADRTGQDLINRTDGSRLALYGDSTAEGATAVSLRDPGWKHKTEVWDEVGGRWENGRYTLTFKNQAAGKCLQPATAE